MPQPPPHDTPPPRRGGYPSTYPIPGCLRPLGAFALSTPYIFPLAYFQPTEKLRSCCYLHITTPRGYGFQRRYVFVCLSVCLSVCLFPYNISKTDAAVGSPNLTQKCSTTSTGNPFLGSIERSKVKVKRHKSIAGVDCGAHVSAGFFWLQFLIQFKFRSAFSTIYFRL